MMRLSDRDIRAKMATGDIGIDPLPSDQAWGPASIDLRLDKVFSVFKTNGRSCIDPMVDDVAAMMESLDVGDDGTFHLHPGSFALGSTIERVTLPSDFVGLLDGRSSLARIGLQVHSTAHTIHPGWDGTIVFEFYNGGPLPIVLRPGLRIGAIAFEALSSPAERPYGMKKDSKYSGQRGIVASRFEKDAP